MGSPSLTTDGRGAAEELVRRYREIEVTREFDRRPECRAYASERGLRDIGRGAKRVVYAVPDDLVTGERDCVLKVAYALTGFYEVRSEAVCWADLSAAARDRFAPVWEHARGWLLSARAGTDVTDADVRQLAASLDEVGWTGEDLKPENVGVLDGRPVLVDYGKGDFEDA